MKEYPSIGRQIQYGVPVYVFDKLDGSNIRAEWSRKRQFYKYASRNRLLGSDQPFLPESIDLIKRDFEKELSDRFTKERYESAVCFFEFWGKSSFAGMHVEEKHHVTLFDVAPYKKGILLPQDFLKLCSGLKTAELLYHGNITVPFVEQIMKGEIYCSGEGVVCKGAPLKKGYPPFMFKIKTNAWIERLKGHCKGNEDLFRRLL